MAITKYSPIIITTLCRYEHFKRCVESLQKCTNSDKTVLYIALDYPKYEHHRDGYIKICQYIPTVIGFKDVRLLKREYNLGPIANELDAISNVSKQYSTYIVTEDDNEFSPNFIDYMNFNLEKFQDDENVYSICGYSLPFKDKAYDKCSQIGVHFFSGWGSAFWRKKKLYQEIDSDKEFINKVLNSWILSFKLYRGRYMSLNNLITMRIYNKYFGDVVFVSRMILRNKYSIFPILSKVRNGGHDGSGEHCSISNFYINQKIDTFDKYICKDTVFIDKPVRKIFVKSDFSFIMAILVMIRYIFFRLFKSDCFKYYYSKKHG